MPDSTLDAIDRIFDFVDKGVDAADRVLNRGKQTDELHRSRRAKRPEVIDADPPRTRKAAAVTTAVARRSRFYIVEAVGPSSTTRFVVTDGNLSRAECSTRELAEQILRALEKGP